MKTRKDDELSREAGHEKTAPDHRPGAAKFTINSCWVMEFDTFEEALAFKTKNNFVGDIVEYDADRADVWHDYYDFDPSR